MNTVIERQIEKERERERERERAKNKIETEKGIYFVYKMAFILILDSGLEKDWSQLERKCYNSGYRKIKSFYTFQPFKPLFKLNLIDLLSDA